MEEGACLWIGTVFEMYRRAVSDLLAAELTGYIKKVRLQACLQDPKRDWICFIVRGIGYCTIVASLDRSIEISSGLLTYPKNSTVIRGEIPRFQACVKRAWSLKVYRTSVTYFS